MIIGIGTDIVEIERISQTIEKFGQRFLDRLFTQNEQAYCESNPAKRIDRYAKRFAAKEAFFKALGTGRSQGLCWKEVEVKNDSMGKPHLILHGNSLTLAKEKDAPAKMVQTHLSLSDTSTLAQAHVILEAMRD